MLTASVLYDRGVALSNAGRHASARRALQQALERTNDGNLRARITGTMAFIVLETGQPTDAAALCADALRARDLSTHTRAVLLGQQGLIELRRGELPAALRLLTRSLPGLVGDPDRSGSIFMNRGVVNLELGRTAEAEDDFANAVRCFEEVKLPADAAKAQHNQGYAALLRGDLVTASRLMDAARPHAAADSPVVAAVGDVDRAEVLLAAGMPHEAAAALTRAAAVYRAHRLRQMQADATWRLAKTLLYSEPRRASSIAGRAARLYRNHGNETGALHADGVALRADVAAGGHSAILLERLAAAAGALAARRFLDEALELRMSAARVLVRRGDLAAARSAMRRLRVRNTTSVTVKTLGHEVRAELAVASGDDRATLHEAADGLDELGEWQALFGSLDLQSSLNMHGQTLTKVGIAAALRSGDIATIFDWSERARQLSTHTVAPHPPDDPLVAEALRELRLLRFSGSLDGEAAGREAELRELVVGRHWYIRGGGRVPDRVSLETTRSAMAEDDAVAIVYLWSGESLTALVLEPDRSNVLSLGRPPIGRDAGAALQAELDMVAAGLPGSMGEAVERSLTNRLAVLSAALIDPVLQVSPRARAASTRLAIITPGILAGTPWSMLPALTGRTVTLPMSATRWVGQRALSARSPGLPPSASRRAGFLAGPNVPRATEEVTMSAVMWPDAAAALGVDATTGRAAELATSADVLHITAHGRHAADNPHFSGIQLADGPWFGYDVERLTAIPSVVLLSACELGRSSVSWGHEALGMARTWLHAGARCVIASPANVNDDAACELLPAVHELLAAGHDPAAALATASADAGASTPFLCYGSGW